MEVNDGRRRGDEGQLRLFDFELDGAEVDAIAALDRGESGRTGPDPNNFDSIPD